MKVLIATSKFPPDLEGFDIICEAIRDLALEDNLKVPKGIIWTNGPGCYNLSFELIGDEKKAEELANVLTYNLMPSKWCTTSDDLPAEDTYQL